jgi:hypothetical protein
MSSWTLGFIRAIHVNNLVEKTTLGSLNDVLLDPGLHEINANNLVKINFNNLGEPQPCSPGPGLHAIHANSRVNINTGEPQLYSPGLGSS